MRSFTRLSGTAAPLLIDNVDTDALAPTPWVTQADVDFGRALFANWRYLDDKGERENPEFVLNQPRFRAAQILIAGDNFGCGSSREHAVWALASFGIRCVVAPSFGDIFYENCFKNGLLPIVLPVEAIKDMAAVLDSSRVDMTVDLETCTLATAQGTPVPFAIDPIRRTALLEGLDEIGITMKDAQMIDAFQTRDRSERPWIYQANFIGA